MRLHWRAGLHQRLDERWVIVGARELFTRFDTGQRCRTSFELWDWHNKHIHWVVAATSSVAIANTAFDVAVAMHPNERLMLRQSIRVARKYEPGGAKG